MDLQHPIAVKSFNLLRVNTRWQGDAPFQLGHRWLDLFSFDRWLVLRADGEDVAQQNDFDFFRLEARNFRLDNYFPFLFLHFERPVPRSESGTGNRSLSPNWHEGKHTLFPPSYWRGVKSSSYLESIPEDNLEGCNRRAAIAIEKFQPGKLAECTVAYLIRPSGK